MNNNNDKNKMTLIIILIIFCVNFSFILLPPKAKDLFWIIPIFLLSNTFVIYLFYILQKRNNAYSINLYNQKEEALVTLNSIGDAVITTNEKGFINFLNPIAQKLTNHSIAQAKGKYLDDVFTLYNENSLQEVSSPIKKVLTKGITCTLDKNIALINNKKDMYLIEDSMAPIKNNKKETIGVIVIFYDITEKKRTSEKLEENKKLLIEQSKMAAMGEMLENIAHQWRQPLSTISTASTGIKVKKELNDLDEEFLMSSLDLINNSSQYLSRTIEDFRNFFRPDKKKEFFLLSNSYERTIALLSSKIKNKNIKLIENIGEFKIEGFENELVQVFMNILNNSIFALENIEEKLIYIDIYKENDFIYIKILDNAGGVAPENISRIFEPYFTTKHQSQGTGIGLYMTSEIISKHMNGNIYFKNKDFIHKEKSYTGAEFLIRFKLK